jgi:hypothetical protein
LKLKIEAARSSYELLSYHIISMQGPPTPYEEDEASIPTEHDERNGQPGPALSAGDRKAAIRTFPWKLRTYEIQLALPQLPRAEAEIRETKRLRLEEPLPTSTDVVATENTTHDTIVALAPQNTAAAPSTAPNAATDRDNSNPVTNTHPNMMTTLAPRNYWTPAEDAQLTRAITNTPKKKHKGEFTSDWIAISAQVPDRTSLQCNHRWRRTLDPSILRTNLRTSLWTEDEDTKLKNAVHKHGGEDWAAIAILVPGRTKSQCHYRWQKVLDPSIKPANGRTGKWTEDEDIQLKNAVHKHAAKDWVAIAALVPDRTLNQCIGRWKYALA